MFFSFSRLKASVLVRRVGAVRGDCVDGIEGVDCIEDVFVGEL